jgi:hypothetical protein
MGKGSGLQQKFTFSQNEPFIGFYGVGDTKTKMVM